MVYEGGGMNDKWINKAQEYLTVVKDGQKQLIVKIAYLSENHSRQEIIRFLKDFIRGKEKELRELILGDKSNCQIDKIIAVMFRVHMAIMTLEKEVNHIVRFKHGATSGRHVRKWDRSRHSGARIRQDKNHDGANRKAGHRARSAA
jgi:hypothetical protein